MEPLQLGHVVGGAQLAACDARFPVQVHRRDGGRALAVGVHPDADAAARLHVEPGLLAHLAHQRVEWVLTLLDEPTRHVPAAAVRITGTPAEQQAAALADDQRARRRFGARVGDDAVIGAGRPTVAHLDRPAATRAVTPAVQGSHVVTVLA